MTNKAEDIMTREVITTTPQATALEAARTLAEHHISGMPVCDQGRLVGILTESDLPGVEPGEVTVRELMTTEVITVAPETPVPEIASLLAQHDIKRVPVMAGDRLVGIVSRGDIVRWIAQGGT